MADRSPKGPSQRVAAAQCPGTTPPGVAATAPGKTADPLVAQATSTAVQITNTVFLLTYFRSAQQPTVAAPPWLAGHPSTALLKDYASNGSPVEVVPEWSLGTIRHAIKKGPHSSTLYPESTALCLG